MISTLMLPNAVIIIPRYIMFRQLKWLNTYIPFYALALFACYPFFIFSMIQFIRGIPKDIDESVKRLSFTISEGLNIALIDHNIFA